MAEKTGHAGLRRWRDREPEQVPPVACQANTPYAANGRQVSHPSFPCPRADWALLLATLAFIFYSLVNIYQSPLSIGDTASQSTVLSLSKSLTALAFALLATLRGLRFRSLLLAWLVSVSLFALTPVIAWLVPTPLAEHLYYLTLGAATSLGLVTLATLFSDFPWRQAKWILLARHFLARMIMLVLVLTAFTDVKFIVSISYALFVLVLALMVVQRTRLPRNGRPFADYDIPRSLLRGSANPPVSPGSTGPPVSPGASGLLGASGTSGSLSFSGSSVSADSLGSSGSPGSPGSSDRRRLPSVKMAFALGGAALSPFILGLFESVANFHGFAYSYTPSINLAITLVTTLVFVIAFAFKREIDIDAAFLVISAASIAFIIWLLFDSRLSSSLYAFLQTSATFYHVALWLFIFKQGAEKTVHPAIAIGISVCVISLARMSGYAISTAALNNALPDEVINSITLWSLTVFALVNLSLFVITLHVQNRAPRASAPQPGEADMNVPREGSGVMGVAGAVGAMGGTASTMDAVMGSTTGGVGTSPDAAAPPDASQTLAAFCRRHDLSSREEQILAKYTSGRSADAIARHYHLSTYTVKTYISRVYRKVNVHNRQALLDLIESESFPPNTDTPHT